MHEYSRRSSNRLRGKRVHARPGAERSKPFIVGDTIKRLRKLVEDETGAATLLTVPGRADRRTYRLGDEGRKSTTAVSRLYIAPAILTAPVVSSSARTALRLRISAMVSSTFFRATASTKS